MSEIKLLPIDYKKKREALQAKRKTYNHKRLAKKEDELMLKQIEREFGLGGGL